MTRLRSSSSHPQPLHCIAAALALAGCLDLSLCAATSAPARADAAPTTSAVWSAVYGGDRGGDDIARTSVPDGRGGVVVVGSSVTSNHHRGITTVDYDSGGRTVWEHSETVPQQFGFYDTHVAVDSSGDATVVTTGRNNGSDGLDPDKILLVATYTPSGARTRRLEVPLPGAEQYVSSLQSYDNSDFSVEGGGYVVDPNTGAQTGCWFAARYDSAGNLLWQDIYDPVPSTPNGFTLSNGAVAAEVNSAGDLVVAGTVTTSTNVDDQHIAVRTYDASGNVLEQTVVTETGSASATAAALALDADDNIYVLGGYVSPAYGSQEIEAVKLSSAGSIDWQSYYISAGKYLDANAITVDSSGDVIAGGNLSSEGGFSGGNPYNEALLVKWDASGNLLWAHGQHKADSANSCQAVFAIVGSDEFWAVDQIADFTPSGDALYKLVVDKYAADGSLASEAYYDGSTIDLDTVIVAGGCYDPATDSLFVIGSQNDAPPSLFSENYNWVTLKY